jgi:transcriptional regulator with XRE-family HTH domain
VRPESSIDAFLYIGLGARLRAERLRRGLSLAAVSAVVEVPVRTISRYETGERKIKVEMLVRLCEVYHLDFYEVLRGAHWQAMQACQKQ